MHCKCAHSAAEINTEQRRKTKAQLHEERKDLHKHQNDRCAVTNVVHRRIVQDRCGIQGRGRCGNHDGYARQEQQRAGRLVDCCAELLCRVLVPPDQETAACRKKKKKVSGVLVTTLVECLQPPIRNNSLQRKKKVSWVLVNPNQETAACRKKKTGEACDCGRSSQALMGMMRCDGNTL